MKSSSVVLIWAFALLLFGTASLRTLAINPPATQPATGIALPGDILRSIHPAAARSSKPPKAVVEWRASVDELAKTVAQLPPNEAAGRWLALVDARSKIAGKSGALFALQFNELFKALPTPAQWPALQDAISDRLKVATPSMTDWKLNLLMSLLRGSPAQIRDAITGLGSKGLPEGFAISDAIEQAAATQPGQSKSASDQFESLMGNPLMRSVQIPDLVTQVGDKQAEVLLRNALLENKELQLTAGDATEKLVRRLALELVNQIPRPQWNLCNSIDAVALYEAMLKKFPPPSTQPAKPGFVAGLLGMKGDSQPVYDENAYPRTQAEQYYLLGLIAANRVDDAMVTAKQLKGNQYGGNSLPYGVLEQMEDAGATKSVFTFLKRYVQDDPGMPYWDELIKSAARVGASDDVLQLARDLSKRPGLSASDAVVVETQLADALLAADQVDEGVGQLRKCLAKLNEDPSVTFDQAVKLATVGRIAGRPALVKEGLDQAASLLRNNSSLQSEVDQEWFYEERLAGRLPEAIDVLGHQLVADQANGAGQHDNAVAMLCALAKAYYFADRPADVLAIFDLFPQWGVKDIVDSPEKYLDKEEPPKSFLLAWALSKTGRKDEAAKVLDYVLEEHGGYDPAYALLLEISPDPTKKLDALFARDQFEERPLIWKAVVLLNAGKPDEAEKACRQAITIDPSDGEEGKGDRMRVYSVLADALTSEMNLKDAKFFRQVVQAIRLAEDADDAWQCNLLSRAVKMYSDALTHFSDAYCIQSRLAVQLADLGRFAEAEEHYRKAYELMPDSFGRVESHCFGCEGAFRGSHAQSIAERVFTKLLQERPKVPQIHYLLGYLRTEQEQWPEALGNFKQAVALDPDYLNAWKKIGECDEHAELSQQEREDTALAVLRLDPAERHASAEVAKFSDLTKLWQAEDAALRSRYTPPAAVYPLTASAAALNAAQPAPRENFLSNEGFEVFERNTMPTTPGEMLLRVTRINDAAEMLNNGNGGIE